MANVGELQPQGARDVGEFAAALRQLKERSGLTYRQLEERAAEHGGVLARSTLADVLSGKTTPRPELVAEFVRACGDAERVQEWLEALERAVSGAAGRDEGGDTGGNEGGEEGHDGGGGADGAGPPDRRIGPAPGRRRLRALLVGLAVLSAVAVTIWVLGFSGEPGGSKGKLDRTALPQGPVQIRPVLADGLCLTDGHAEGYEPLVAVQRPCEDVAPQQTELVPAADDTFRVQWYHPDHGKGCLNSVTVGTGAALLEPWEDCGKTSRFRIEPADSGRSDQYVLRLVGDGCVGMSGSGTVAGVPAVTQPCDASGKQIFSILPA
ncbi:helix-turn-helix domain-containing protein (plasmid) [Streptomyces uncialis]|uniref:helix-turn-helix transcriptional regulator n=1 Tax=Streptomyces uncialis TaxID=1048205 RepID=UPI002E377BF7|nr:helix-turn-helix transcriptional regulator [Streptomyces uncialis]